MNGYTYYCDHGRLTMLIECVRDCSRPGPADAAVAYWVPLVSWDGIDADGIRAELKECGAWDDDELADDDENRARFLWIAAGHASEEMKEGGAA